jgi:DNA-binding FadR family transcriptional regulator
VQGEDHLRSHLPLALVDAHFHAALLRATENPAIETFSTDHRGESATEPDRRTAPI